MAVKWGRFGSQKDVDGAGPLPDPCLDNGRVLVVSYSTAQSRYRTAPRYSFCDWYFINRAYCTSSSWRAPQNPLQPLRTRLLRLEQPQYSSLHTSRRCDHAGVMGLPCLAALIEIGSRGDLGTVYNQFPQRGYCPPSSLPDPLVGTLVTLPRLL